MEGLDGIVDELVRNPIYLIFLLLVIFLVLVIVILAFFLLKQNRVLARLETQMKGFTPESTNVITNQRLSAVFDQQPQAAAAQQQPGGFDQAMGGGFAQPAAQQQPVAQPALQQQPVVQQGGFAGATPPPAQSTQPPPPQAGVLTQYQEGTGEGITEIENKLKDDPNNPDLLDWLAFMYYSNNKLDKAIEIYQRALNLNYENEHQHYYLGNSFYKKGIIDRAIEEWEVVISLKPNSKISHNAQERINKAKQALAQQQAQGI